MSTRDSREGAGVANGAGEARPIADRILGLVGGGMILLALLVLVFGGPGDGAAAAEGAPPELRILAPADGTILDGPLSVDFTSSAELAPQPGGWGTGDLHVHLRLGDRELMAAGETIRRLPAGAYRWTVGPLPAGEHTLRLFWSGADHRPLTNEGTEPIRVRSP